MPTGWRSANPVISCVSSVASRLSCCRTARGLKSPAECASDERPGDDALAEARRRERDDCRCGALRTRRDRAEKCGPFQRAAGLLAEPRSAREDPGGVV